MNDRESLVAMLCTLLGDVAGPGRPRMLAVQELRLDAGRKPWLASLLDAITAADFIKFEHAQRSAGLPVTPQRAATVTLALHAAIFCLLAGGDDTRAAAGLHDLKSFVNNLLETAYGPRSA